jgi:cytochrome c-type biogenesis protein CcsB
MKALAFIFSLLFSIAVFASAGDALLYLPVQDGGRIKPYDTFAKEGLKLVYGKEKYEGRPASEIVLTWLLQPTAWQDRPFIEIRRNQLKKALKFPEEQRYFSPNELFNNERLQLVLQELQAKRETKEKLDPYYQSVQTLEGQLFFFREMASGRILHLIPDPAGSKWISVDRFDEVQNQAFMELSKAFAALLGSSMSAGADLDLAKKNLDEAVEKFKVIAGQAKPAEYQHHDKIATEVHYNKFHPFKWAWILYALGAFAALVAWVSQKNWAYLVSWISIVAGLVLNIYGFVLRVYLTGRAPVSNMYETVVWVGFGAIVFAMIIEAIYKWRVILFGGGLVGAFALILADLAPAVLDPSLQPLEPVLRSNFWLTIHVLVITISYSAFFLAFVLADLGLIYVLKGEDREKNRLSVISLGVYRSMQIGVALLAPGIILGGIWADYSWGRFWGWDPKETWALIALLGYLAVLHARLAGLVKDFGTLVSAVVAFSLVIMAWYGVNFVLGAGLHSYGFGAGGVEYVTAFVVAHIIFVIFVALVRRDRLTKK